MAREGEFQTEKTTDGKRRALVRMVVDSFETSRDVYQVSYKRYNRSYRLYRAWKLGKAVPYRSNVAIPILFSLVQSDVAKKLDLLFGLDPFVTFRAVGPEDQILARKRTALVNTQMEDADTFDKATKFLTSAAIFGTTPYKWFWDVRKELVQFRADLGTGESSYASEQITYDGPNWEPVDVRNFFPEPGKSRIRDMSWVVERFFLDKEDINRLAEAGFYRKAAAADLQYAGRHPGGKDEFLPGANPATGGIDAEGEFRVPEHKRPVEILQFWGRVPRGLAVEGEVNLVVTVGERSVLLRSEANPFGEIPFGEYAPMPDPWHWHSPSKVEVAEKLQIATNAMASQKIDVLQMFADPQFFYNRRAAPPTTRLWSRPGAWHAFDGPVNSENIQPVIPDLRGVQNLYTELEQQAQWMEQGTGIIRDAIQGTSGPDRETARAFLGRQAAANVRLTMEAKIAENQWIEPLAMKFVKMNRMFLPFPRTVRMMGANAIIDPITFKPVPNEAESLFINDMLPDYDARAVGVIGSLGRGAQFQQMVLLMQLAQSNPLLINMVNWMSYWRQLLVMADVPNPDEMMGTDGIIMQAVAQQMAQLAGGGQGGQVGMAPGGGANIVPIEGIAGGA